jgi:hypothetical protein
MRTIGLHLLDASAPLTHFAFAPAGILATVGLSSANSIATGRSQLKLPSSDRGFIAMRKAPKSIAACTQVFRCRETAEAP